MTGDLNIPISSLTPPELASLPYKDCWNRKRTAREDRAQSGRDLAPLVPADQYFLQLNSMQSLDELLDLSAEWGGSLLRLFTVEAQRPAAAAEAGGAALPAPRHADAAVCRRGDQRVAFTGGRPVRPGGHRRDRHLPRQAAGRLQAAAAGWLAAARKAHADLTEADFNYRGHKVAGALYGRPRRQLLRGRAQRLRRSIRTRTAPSAGRWTRPSGASPALYDSLDYRYVTTLLPPAAAANSGYFFVPEAMIRRLVGPAAKISEKRRLQCYNNLVMLNNASLFYRMEFGRSPSSLAELVEGRFVDPAKIVCPHGGAYAYDPGRDACTCSLHNRLKYLTPNIELTVLSVSQNESAEYDRYKQRYQAFWQGMFDPDRRADHGGPPREAGDLRAADGQRRASYNELRAMVDKTPRPLGTARHRPLGGGLAGDGARPQGDRPAAPRSAGRGRSPARQSHAHRPGWLGDRVSLHFCDGRLDPAGRSGRAASAATARCWAISRSAAGAGRGRC